MMENLYKTLGVSSKASPEAIKKAHRKLVQKHHPDAGGDAERFMEIDRAFKVLFDADRRKAYDETGQVDAKSILSEMDDVRAVMADLYSQMLSSGVAFDERVSIVDSMRKMVKTNIQNFQAQIDDFAATISELEKVRETITVDDGKENIFVQVTNGHIEKLEGNMVELKKSLHIGNMVLDELQNYKSFSRAVQTVQMWSQTESTSLFSWE